MGFFSKLQNIEKKYALTFLGFLLAAIIGALSIYTSFFRKINPQVRYTVNSILGVYDIREEVGKLDIIYDGINIRENKQMLSLISFNIANVGHEHVTKAMYDNNAPLGFKLNGGLLLKTEIFEASNPYLIENTKINLESQQIAHFSPVIIDSGESFSVKILVLHNEDEFPEISPLGKIAGVKKIELIPWSRETLKKPFWSKVISGGIRVHLTRAICYLIAIILIGLTIGIPTALLSEYASKHKRKRHVQEFKTISNLSFKQKDDFIFESYINMDELYLLSINNLLSSKKPLENAIHSYQKNTKKEDFDDIKYEKFMHDVPIRHYPSFFLIRELLDSGFIRKEKKEIIVNSHMQNTLNAFLRFLKGKGVNLHRNIRVRSVPYSEITHLEKKED